MPFYLSDASGTLKEILPIHVLSRATSWFLLEEHQGPEPIEARQGLDLAGFDGRETDGYGRKISLPGRTTEVSRYINKRSGSKPA